MAGNSVDSKNGENAVEIETPPQLSTALTIEPSANKVVKIGESFTIKATLSPDNVYNKNVKWTSSNTSLATISTNETTSGTSITVTAKKTGAVTITATPADGQAQYAKSVTVTINPLIIADISPKYYGDYMDYPVELGLTTAEHALVDGTVPKTDWRVFYKDDAYTYLIASDYIPTSKFPDGVFNVTYGEYCGCWSPAPNGTTPTYEYKERFLWNGLGTISTSNENYKCISYLLNTDLWSDFTNNTYAEACIGGPTIEMMCASWTAKTPSQPLYFGVNSTGYAVGKQPSGLIDHDFSFSDYEGCNNALYFPHNNSKMTGNWNDCNGYWLSSPSSYGGGFVLRMAYGNSIINSKRYFEYSGIRPVIMLKSTLLAEKHDVDGIWEIKGVTTE